MGYKKRSKKLLITICIILLVAGLCIFDSLMENNFSLSSALLDFLFAIPLMLLFALIVFSVYLFLKLSEPNPFNRTIGKKPYFISKCFIELQRTTRYDSKLLYIALSDMVYTYNAEEFDLKLRDISGERHILTDLELFPITKLDLSQLGPEYNDEFHIAHSFAEEIYIPPHSSSVSFNLNRNARLKKLILNSPRPIPVCHVCLDCKEKPIVVAKDFIVCVPSTQLSVYEQAELWQRLSFCTEAGTPVPLRFEAIP